MTDQPLLIALVAVQFIVHALGWSMTAHFNARWRDADGQFAAFWLLLAIGLLLYVPAWPSGSAPRNIGDVLIVVAVILIIAAIAIPNLLSAKRTSQNSQAAANLRTVTTAIKIFQGACTQALPLTISDMANNGATAPTANEYQAGGGTTPPVCAAVNQVGAGQLGPQWITGSAFMSTNPFTYAYTVPAATGGGWSATATCNDTTKCSDAFYIDANGTFTHTNDGIGTTPATVASVPVS